ncbi:MAG TPA: DUF5829 family protein [Blastocatellia bacterium]|nr:DUF5829 family protein [Blastocatellia bacterium]
MKFNRQIVKRAVNVLCLVSAMSMLLAARATRFEPPAKESMDPIYLNHFFLTVDPQTYKEISESQFLKDEFAAFEQRTTVRADMTYTGIYFYGTRTYFEFFEAGKASGRMEGASGVASGIEARGGSDRLKGHLESSLKIGAMKTTITRKTNDKDVPWFHSVGGNFGNKASVITTWTMEYHEDFLNNWYPELSPRTRGITREEVLERYTAKLGDNEKRKQKYIDDVIEMRLALDEKDGAGFIKERESFGYKILSDADKTTCEGPGIKYVVTARTPESVGITAIKLSLRKNKTGQKVYRFGRRSVLQFNDDRTATWSF